MRWLDQLTVCLCIIVAAAHDSSDPPVVQTAQGKVKGKIIESYTGKKILSFTGVRFAEPPIGENRFKPPVPLKSWNGIRNATEDGPLCPQPVSEGLQTSEDCLFLNVHTKTLTGKQPVIIHLHSGAFSAGTGNSFWYGPQYLLNRDVVMVNFNYRLGPLGFLSTGDSVLPGNYGLKDQLAVLKWVNQNIEKFGGDPGKVTLFGYSAGATSTHLHMVSPLSRGLFHRAIVSSCSFTTPAAFNRDPASIARRVAKILNCPTETSQQIRDCLVPLPEADIRAAASKIQDTVQPSYSLFAPVVEKHDGEDRFLTEDPMKLFKSGQFAQVPIITGITRDEFSWLAQLILVNDTYVNRINREFYEIAPWEFSYPREPRDLSKRISSALKQFYLNNQPMSNSTEKGLGKLYADSVIIFSVVQAAKLIAEKSSAPTYFYMFNFEGRFSYQYSLGTQTPYGVVHHDDLIYLFKIEWFPTFNESDPEAHMVRSLTSIYSSFAKDGTPTLPQTEEKWLPMTKNHLQFLDINRELKMRDGLPYPKRMQLWESLLPLDQPYRQIFY